MKNIDLQSLSQALITLEPITGFCLPFTFELIEKLKELMDEDRIYRKNSRGNHLTLIAATCCKHLANQLGGENSFTANFGYSIEEMPATTEELKNLLDTAQEFANTFMKR